MTPVLPRAPAWACGPHDLGPKMSETRRFAPLREGRLKRGGQGDGADDGNRTRILSLGSSCSAIELHPRRGGGRSESDDTRRRRPSATRDRAAKRGCRPSPEERPVSRRWIHGAACARAHARSAARRAAGSSGTAGPSGSRATSWPTPSRSSTAAAMCRWPRVDMWIRSTSHIRESRYSRIRQKSTRVAPSSSAASRTSSLYVATRPRRRPNTGAKPRSKPVKTTRCAPEERSRRSPSAYDVTRVSTSTFGRRMSLPPA